ncbi:hypothetical protein Tco_1443583 [Tanacetum coccineum]
MMVMQAYNATSNELHIPLPQAPIAPPTVLPPFPVLPLFDPQDFFLLEEILPPQKQARFLSSSSTDFSTQPQIKTILNHLDELPLKRIEHIEDKIKGLGNGRREQIRHDDEIVLARVRTYTLEILIEDIQIRHRSDMKSLLDETTRLDPCHLQLLFRIQPLDVTMALLPSGFLKPLYPDIMDMINDQNIEHTISPTPPPDYPLMSYLSGHAPAMSQAAIRKLVNDNVVVALEAQAATMTNTDNTNRNIGQSGTPIARKCSYKEFMSYQPFNFKGTEGAVSLTCWFEQTESVFLCSNCTEDYKVKFGIGTLTEEALPWWN